MIYTILFYVTLGYLVIAFLIAFYLQKELLRQLPLVEKIGEMGSIAVGMCTTAVLWPIWLVKLFILGFKYVTRGEK